MDPDIALVCEGRLRRRVMSVLLTCFTFVGCMFPGYCVAEN